MDDFGGSVAGGGRYDKMIGKFTGKIHRHADFPLDLRELSCCFWKMDISSGRTPEKGISSGEEASKRGHVEGSCSCKS